MNDALAGLIALTITFARHRSERGEAIRKNHVVGRNYLQEFNREIRVGRPHRIYPRQVQLDLPVACAPSANWIDRAGLLVGDLHAISFHAPTNPSEQFWDYTVAATPQIRVRTKDWQAFRAISKRVHEGTDGIIRNIPQRSLPCLRSAMNRSIVHIQFSTWLTCSMAFAAELVIERPTSQRPKLRVINESMTGDGMQFVLRKLTSSHYLPRERTQLTCHGN